MLGGLNCNLKYKKTKASFALLKNPIVALVPLLLPHFDFKLQGSLCRNIIADYISLISKIVTGFLRNSVTNHFQCSSSTRDLFLERFHGRCAIVFSSLSLNRQ